MIGKVMMLIIEDYLMDHDTHEFVKQINKHYTALKESGQI